MNKLNRWIVLFASSLIGLLALVVILTSRASSQSEEVVYRAVGSNKIFAVKDTTVELNYSNEEDVIKKIEPTKSSNKVTKKEKVTVTKQETHVITSGNDFITVNGKRYDKLNVPTYYTPEQLHQALVSPNWSDKISKFMGPENNFLLEDALLQIESKYSVNALFIMAVVVQESGWGRRTPAGYPYNFFGYGVTDSGITSAASIFNHEGSDFDKLVHSLSTYANKMSERYLTPGAPHWDGAGVGKATAFWNGVPFVNGKEVGYTTLGVAKAYNQHGTWQEKIQNIISNFRSKVK